VSDRVHLVWEVIPFEKNFYWLPFTPSFWLPNRSFILPRGQSATSRRTVRQTRSNQKHLAQRIEAKQTKNTRRKLSVRKVVQTLTSTSAEIYLSMAGAKQLGDTSFILVPAGAVRPAGVCSRHCIALHHGACRGELHAWWERRLSLQVPEV
jgi:hypothetical protein